VNRHVASDDPLSEFVALERRRRELEMKEEDTEEEKGPDKDCSWHAKKHVGTSATGGGIRPGRKRRGATA